jgi:hypothetical protein
MFKQDIIEIKSRDYWFKIVDFLQQNWALIEIDGTGVVVFFFGDLSGVFDKLTFATEADAVVALKRNGFGRLSQDLAAQKLISAPKPPFYNDGDPDEAIYSSGRFWIF